MVPDSNHPNTHLPDETDTCPPDTPLKREYHRYDMSDSVDMVYVAVGDSIAPFPPIDFSAHGLAFLAPTPFQLPQNGKLTFRGTMFEYTVRYHESHDYGTVVGLALTPILPKIEEVIPDTYPFIKSQKQYFAFIPSRPMLVVMFSLSLIGFITAQVLLSHEPFRANAQPWLAGLTGACKNLSGDTSTATWLSDTVAEGSHRLLQCFSNASLGKHMRDVKHSLTIRQLKRATSALHANNWDAAILAATKAMELDPASPDAYHLRGLARLSLGQHPFAILDLKQSLSLDISNSHRCENIVTALCKHNMYAEALEIGFREYKRAPEANRKEIARLISSIYRAACGHFKESVETDSLERLSEIARQWEDYSAERSFGETAKPAE